MTISKGGTVRSSELFSGVGFAPVCYVCVLKKSIKTLKSNNFYIIHSKVFYFLYKNKLNMFINEM